MARDFTMDKYVEKLAKEQRPRQAEMFDLDVVLRLVGKGNRKEPLEMYDVSGE